VLALLAIPLAAPAPAAAQEVPVGEVAITLLGPRHVQLVLHGAVAGEAARLHRGMADGDHDGKVSAEEAAEWAEATVARVQGQPVRTPAGRIQLGGRDPSATTLGLELPGAEGPANGTLPWRVVWTILMEYPEPAGGAAELRVEPGAQASRMPRLHFEASAAAVRAGPGLQVTDAAGLPLLAERDGDGVRLPGGLDPSLPPFTVTFSPRLEERGAAGPGLPTLLLAAALALGRRLRRAP
jgi:hypothetical protein